MSVSEIRIAEWITSGHAVLCLVGSFMDAATFCVVRFTEAIYGISVIDNFVLLA